MEGRRWAVLRTTSRPGRAGKKLWMGEHWVGGFSSAQLACMLRLPGGGRIPAQFRRLGSGVRRARLAHAAAAPQPPQTERSRLGGGVEGAVVGGQDVAVVQAVAVVGKRGERQLEVVQLAGGQGGLRAAGAVGAVGAGSSTHSAAPAAAPAAAVPAEAAAALPLAP